MLESRDIDLESDAYISSYRSFEGEAFENFMYEKLIRYAKEHKAIKKFIVKGAHAKKGHAQANTLSLSSKSQIVYRTKNKEIGEFDGLMFTDTELFFVEMTLVKSVRKLRHRLRKKHALLETLFPNYEIKALLILNEGVSGIRELQDYCTVWITKPYSAKDLFAKLKSEEQIKKEPFAVVKDKKMTLAEELEVHPFRYYNTLGWVLRKVRSKKQALLNIGFMKSTVFTRYHDLFTKIYIGYMDGKEFEKMVPNLGKEASSQVMVAIEKEPSGKFVLTYFMHHARKKLDNVIINDSGVKVAKKDPFGITVTEVIHMNRIMDESYKLSIKNIKTANMLIQQFS